MCSINSGMAEEKLSVPKVLGVFPHRNGLVLVS